MPWIAALPSTISSTTPATPTRSATTTTRMSLSITPSESSTTPSDGSVSSPVNGGGEEGGDAPPDHEQSKHDIAEPVVKQEPQTRTREPLEPPDHLHQSRDEALLLSAR